MIITSLENKKVKDVVKLQSKKYRDLTNAFVVETEHLVEEANKCGIVKAGTSYHGKVIGCCIMVVVMKSVGIGKMCIEST